MKLSNCNIEIQDSKAVLRQSVINASVLTPVYSLFSRLHVFYYWENTPYSTIYLIRPL